MWLSTPRNRCWPLIFRRSGKKSPGPLKSSKNRRTRNEGRDENSCTRVAAGVQVGDFAHVTSGLPLHSHLFGIRHGGDRPPRRITRNRIGGSAPAALPSLCQGRVRSGGDATPGFADRGAGRRFSRVGALRFPRAGLANSRFLLGAR